LGADKSNTPRLGGREGAYRSLKPPFSRSATVSPSREAVNHAVCGKDSPLSMTIRPLNRPEFPDSDGRCPQARKHGPCATPSAVTV